MPPLTGRCNCGIVQFEVTEPLLGAAYCHCRRCQRRTGTTFSLNSRAQPGTFRVLTGRDRLNAWKPRDGSEKWFCGDCGSALFTRDPADPELVGIRMGAFDDDPGVRPSHHQFVAYAAPWDPIPDDGLPRYPERPPS